MEEGLILGRYRLLAELGEGGHGSVDLAFDTKMARRVAIKRIPVSRRGIEILSRTTGLREARTAAMLNHPGIVTVYEWDTDDDEAFLIMEHVDGASLAEILDLYAPLNADEAAAVVGQVADAISFAHENGVLHLDLKPENVLVTRAGLVKVADFGVAALTNAAGQAISAGGTLGYMAPEQLRAENVDVRTDVWAFGALALQVLTGAVPYAADNVEGSLFKIERTGMPPASSYVKGLPAALDAVLSAAMEPDPADRQTTVAELADELLAHLGDPEAGRESLHRIATELTAEDEELEEEAFAQLGLWDRLAYRADLGERIACALASAWLGWSGIAAFAFAWPIAAAVVLICGIAGYFTPVLGLGTASVMLAVGAFATNPVLGIVVTLGAGLWWFFVARLRPAAGAVPVFAPLLGVIHASPALPLLAGFFVEGVWPAAAAGAMSGLVVAVTAVVGRSTTLTDVAWPALVAPLGAPGPSVLPGGATLLRTAVLVAAWALAATLASLGCRRGTRGGALVGMLAGLGVTAVGLGPWLTGGSRMDPSALVALGIGSILVFVVVALGPPVPGGAEDDREE